MRVRQIDSFPVSAYYALSQGSISPTTGCTFVTS